jgi:hypothetical protein
MNLPDFRLGRSVIWKLADKYVKSEEEVRRAQRLQFQIETAAAGNLPAEGAAGKVVTVHTEDENGEVIVP